MMDDADRAQETEERIAAAQGRREAATRAQAARQAEAASKRFARGETHCGRCGGEITLERLEANPTTCMCTTCAKAVFGP
jgi:RNA polymerase-binding transcription factor DksA